MCRMKIKDLIADRNSRGRFSVLAAAEDAEWQVLDGELAGGIVSGRHKTAARRIVGLVQSAQGRIALGKPAHAVS